LAKGISIALNTTLTGLLIAIPSLIAWSYYNKKVETMAIELEALCDELLRIYYPPSSAAKQAEVVPSDAITSVELEQQAPAPKRRAKRRRDSKQS
ncbi:MAG: MotA/TolQ/ExbB proton channel family protein, partial [Verrucomicrobiota bacterium]|nr:MotA/TolQ/ExbB proton channel family protein [Verrucomicrobiota bacterium]